MENWLVYISLVFGLISALVAGVFQSFSDFVMAGLHRSTPAGGIECMQQINRTVFRSFFLACFLALVPMSMGFAIYATLQTQWPGKTFVVAAAVTYLVTVFGVTVVGNIPMNQRLDKLDPTSPQSVDYWHFYCRIWTRWNHVRTIGSVVTALLFLLAATGFGSAT